MYSPRKQGPGRAKNVKALKMVISAIVVIPALAHIFYIGATSSLTNYYLSVDELLAQGPSLRGEEVRLAGEVVPGSIEWEWSTSTLRFQVGDKGSIPVIYRGLPPDTFRGASPSYWKAGTKREAIFGPPP